MSAGHLMHDKRICLTRLWGRNVKQSREIVDDVYIFDSFVKASDIAYLR